MSIRITARPQRGIRRCGLHHPPEPVIYADSHFSDEELERLLRDPNLVVELGDGDDDHLSVLDGREGTDDVGVSLARPPLVDGEAPGRPAGETQTADSTSSASLSAEGSEAASRADGSRSDSNTTDAAQTGESPAGDRPTESDRLSTSTAPEIPEIPAVTKLEQLLGTITDVRVVRAMQERDTRITAQPLYEARLYSLGETG